MLPWTATEKEAGIGLARKWNENFPAGGSTRSQPANLIQLQYSAASIRHLSLCRAHQAEERYN